MPISLSTPRITRRTPPSCATFVCMLTLTLLLAASILTPAHAATAGVAEPPSNIGSVDGSSESKAYLIESLSNLVWLQEAAAAGNTDNKYFSMTRDIDASDSANWNDDGTTTNRLEGFYPIGTAANPFNGFFNGNGYRVTGLKMDRPSTNYVGLFGYSRTGTISNLDLVDGFVTGSSYVGMLIAYISDGSVSDCHAAGIVYAKDNAGGLVGYGSRISNCRANVEIMGASTTGGLAGSAASVSSCQSTGNVIGSRYVGGLIGYGLSRGTVHNSSAMGWVSGGSDYVGGLVGGGDFLISNCFATGAVSGWNYTGGLVGGGSRGMEKCSASGIVNGYGYTGGLCGSFSGATIVSCSATGRVSGNYTVGGLIGLNSGMVSNCYAAGLVRAKGEDPNIASTRVGGLIGSNQGPIDNCYAAGDVILDVDPSLAYLISQYIGGLTGNNYGQGKINHCFALGSVKLNPLNDADPIELDFVHIGGLNGSRTDDTVILNSYWDVQSTGQATSAGGIGLTTLQLRRPTNLTSWDFTEIWAVQGGYPYLRSFPTCMLTYQAGVHGKLSDGLTYGPADLVQTINRGARSVPVSAVSEPNFLFARWSDNALANPRSDAGVTTNLTVTALYFSPTLLPNLSCSEFPITINHQPTWSWNSYQGSTIFRYQLDGQSDSAWVVTLATLWTPATPLPLGTHTLYVQELNLSGQWSPSAQSTIRISSTTAARHWSAYE
jgi:hypothetical protein